jgi:orotate phosphoribosyltransferase
MRNVQDLIDRAHELKKRGLTTGEIADELNLSRHTALWLVTHEKAEAEGVPRDIYVEWSAIGSNPVLLTHISLALEELIRQTVEENGLPQPEVIAGIANSGVPLATIIAGEMGASLAVIRPKKHLWEPEKEAKESASLLSNFAEVKGKNVIIVDDIATTGTTLRETMEFLEEMGANTLAAVVLIDKKGIRNIGSKPVRSLLGVEIVEEMTR